MGEQLKKCMVVFSDLDGTLLDHSTYSFEAAKPALQMLRKRGIPVVISTSKTRAEVEIHRKALNNTDPFIVENGGAIFVPIAYFLSISSLAVRRDDYWMISLGAEYEELLEGLGALKAMTGNAVKGFSDMSAEEVAGITGLSLEHAVLAKKREFDEPIVPVSDKCDVEQVVPPLAQSIGLRCQKGGRFCHLTGDNDKGKAMEFLKERYRSDFGDIVTVAIGDSALDVPLLSHADIAIAVQRPDGTYEKKLLECAPKVRKASGAGPAGWNRAVLDLLNER